MELLNYNITPFYPHLPVSKRTIINTINPHSYCVAKKDVVFRQALQESDILLPDGIGVVMAAKFLKNEKIPKIAGYDIFMFLMNELQKKGGKCFFLGASEKTLQLIRKRAASEFPKIKVYSFSPPFKTKFSNADNAEMCKRVNKVKPDVLFVGMTAPKQEKWVHENKLLLDVQTICSIGAVFDFYSGTIDRAPQFMVKFGLEWLHRSVMNPKKLGMRNLRSNPEFLIDVFKEKMKIKNENSNNYSG